MKWISIEEQLPPNNIDIIMFHDVLGIYTGYVLNGEYYFYAYGEPFYNHVTHWMPLPEPPKI